MRGRCLWEQCCPVCHMVGKVWGKGDIECRDLVASKCEYLARYVTKKMTKKDDPRLRGRFPEFSRQSKQAGGIGFPSLDAMAEVIKRYVSNDDLIDVPLAINYGKKSLPLGRYLRRKLRKRLGRDEAPPREVVEQAWNEQMLPLLLAARKSKDAPSLAEQIRLASIPYEMKMQWYEENASGKEKL